MKAIDIVFWVVATISVASSILNAILTFLQRRDQRRSGDV